MADPDDRTATMAPRDPATMPTEAAPTESAPLDAAAGQLPVDDPERYEQIAEQGRGGLGRVMRAVDRRLGRTVAVKELLRHDEAHEARFVREALITARLEHPGIVPVHEAGRWPNGAPYYVMKMVEGRTLKELIAERPTVQDRLGLLSNVIAIADAVGYAHKEGVIHRDLKPSNVIVGAFGETVVIDWGLARDRKQDLPEPTAAMLAAGSGVAGADRTGPFMLATMAGKVVGTPQYMAPEQARGDVVDERADVYAIGAVLYEVLRGSPPYDEGTPDDMIARVVAGPPPPIQEIAPGTPHELADIVGKAMARSPVSRYPNARALAEDLRRFQTGKLVRAHDYTPWQIVKKKLGQHRGVVVVAIASAIALAVIGVESFRKVVAERDIAQGERARAEEARASAEERKRELVLVQAETSLRKDPTAALAWLKLHPVSDRDAAKVVDVIDEAISLGTARHVLRPDDWVFDAAFTPDGKSLVAIARDGKLRRYDVASGALHEIGHTPSPPWALAIAPDGTFAVTGGTTGEVIAWPLGGGPQKTLVPHGRLVVALRFVADGRIVVQRDGGPAQLVGLDGKLEGIGPDTALRSTVAAGNPARRIAQVTANRVVAIEPAGPRELAETEHSLDFIALSPSGDHVVVHDGQSVWGVPYTGGPLVKLAAYEGELDDAVWSPDGKTVALAGRRPEVVMVELATGDVRELRGHTDAVFTVEFTRDGKQMLTASDDGTARLWNLRDGRSIALRGHDDDVYRARLSPDERLAVSASIDGSIRVWPLAAEDGRALEETGDVTGLTITGDRALVATPSSLARWDLATGKREPLFAWADDPRSVGAAVPSPDGTKLYVPGPAWSLVVRRIGAPPVSLRGHRALVSHVEWSADSSALYSSSYDGTLRRWDVATGKGEELVKGSAPVRTFAVARDGRIAATVGDSAMLIRPDGTQQAIGGAASMCAELAWFEPVKDRLFVQRCDRSAVLIDGARSIEMPTDGYAVIKLAVSPDGTRIAGALGDRTVRVWSAAGQLLETLRGHTDLVLDVAFSPDGTHLASASHDGTIRVWELGAGRHRVLRGHHGAVERVAWHGNGELVTGSEDGTVRVWPAPSTAAPAQAEITRRLDEATTARIDDRNRATTP